MLLYNLRGQKRAAVLLCLRRLWLGFREVAAEEQGLPLGALLGLEGCGAAESGGDAPFSEEMLVMHALSGAQFNGLLDALRRGKTPIALKAVVTPHNVSWSSARLRRELLSEHLALNRNR